VAGHDVVLAVLELLAVDVGELLALGVGEAGALPPHAAMNVTHRHAIPTPVRTGHPCVISRTDSRCFRRSRAGSSCTQRRVPHLLARDERPMLAAVDVAPRLRHVGTRSVSSLRWAVRRARSTPPGRLLAERTCAPGAPPDSLETRAVHGLLPCLGSSGEGIPALSARSVNLGCPGRPRSLRRSIEVNECSGVMSSSDPPRGSSGFGITKGCAYFAHLLAGQESPWRPGPRAGRCARGKSDCPRFRRATLASLLTIRRPGPPGPHSRSCGRRSSSPNAGRYRVRGGFVLVGRSSHGQRRWVWFVHVPLLV
jgi:hypothetical protein